MGRLRRILRTHGTDALVVVAAAVGAVGTAARTDPSMPTGPGAWAEVAAITEAAQTIQGGAVR